MKRKILQIILGIITKGIIKKYNPKVVAVTGSAGKTSTKNAVSYFLKNYFSVRKSVGNLNTEFGAPLVFIGCQEGGGNSFVNWLKIILSGFKLILFKDVNYPKIVIVEMGADKPGDISYLTKMVKPHISIVTLIGKIPVHLENYENLNQLISEKSKIVEILNENDYSVLNFDDIEVKRMKEKTKSKTIFFGFDETSEIKISDFEYNQDNEKNNGISFKIEYKDSIKKINLLNCYGKAFAYTVAASISCGVALGIDFENIDLKVFRDLKPEKGRMNLIESTNGSFVLDDTYNASPVSVKSALEVVTSLGARKRIVALGDMKELGSESGKAHREIGEIIFGLADYIITVGKEAKKIKERAIEVGFNVDNAYHFNESEEAINTIKEISGVNDLILIKGSRSMEMDKITKALI